jgi:hypothetical protein
MLKSPPIFWKVKALVEGENKVVGRWVVGLFHSFRKTSYDPCTLRFPSLTQSLTCPG